MLSDNGIIGKGKQSKEEYEVAQILDRLNTIEAGSFTETLGSNNLESFIKQMKKEEYVNEAEDNLVREEDGVHASVIIDEYVFNITDVEGDIQFEYIGMEWEVPLIFKVNKVTSNSISIVVMRPNNATDYTYYYKNHDDTEYNEGVKNNKNIYEFTGLQSNTIYDIKVVATIKERKVEGEKSAVVGKMPEGTITFNNLKWQDGKGFFSMDKSI